MKKIRISFKSFEKAMNSFVEKRIIASLFDTTTTEGKLHSQLIDNDTIKNVAKQLILKYKSKPFANKSGFSFKPSPISTGFLLHKYEPIDRFLLTWNFKDNSLYFKFFVRFKNGSKNKKYKQMVIDF